MMETVLLEAREIHKRYPLRTGPLQLRSGWIEAVKGVSLTIHTGETIALVGESGCGKSTLAKCLTLLEPATTGDIFYKGSSVTHLRGLALTPFRRQVQMVFQDPMGSLNPRMSIGQTIAEPMQIHRMFDGSALKAKVERLLEEVGLDPRWINRFPQTLSGGQRQRVGIARALALNPSVLICDEPVSSLDLSIQAQILNLLLELAAKRSLGILFISHNLRVVSSIADRILVMKEGLILEEAPNPQLFEKPKHPYTQRLVKLALEAI